ncbi:zinc-binding alcohol dehydrogenase family protein [Shinella granuli]|uniref:Zinc-type alcohol dehydrogenase-like protein n=2 Tax=Shinella granuli TaxID=323621 RepID=A0A4R2CQG7_SHIGR|nr:zinc-binding alcohol dehydrogenase family protein [Shinella granuli]
MARSMEQNTGNPNYPFYGGAIIGEGRKTYLLLVHTRNEALSPVHLPGRPCFSQYIFRSFKMRAIGYENPQSIDATTALVDIDLPRPEPTGRDILVEVKAVSVNPVDTKIRASAKAEPGQWRVLGWDAAGIVTAVGPQASLFKPGDTVFYAGAINRPGTNAEYHLVDERIVGNKPASLDFPAAAALPLTSITAWEMLFDRLDVTRPVAGAADAILIIGGAGGVGSIAIQIARALTDLTVIATASRPETQDWVKALGAHHVIDHRKPLAAQVEALGIGQPAFVFSTTNTDDHLGEIVELIAPQGRFGLIDDPKTLDALPLKRKSISLHWELMFTRSLFATADIEKQHALLNRVSALVDAGKIKSTLNKNFGTINAENLKRAHALIESGKAKGKIVLAGF